MTFTTNESYNLANSKIHIFNSLGGKRIEFKPIDPSPKPTVNFYVCGLTPWDHSHLGHALAALRFDIIRRYLEYRNLKVNFVTNVTDIEDKIINRAKETGEDPLEFTQRFTDEYFEGLDQLGVLRPNKLIKVTESLDGIKKMIGSMVENGSAYATSQGNVYFDVAKKADYGKLSGQKVSELKNSVRISGEEDKKAAPDFALWKRDDSSSLSCQSDWGIGRPGWHIECSAMIHEAVGDTLDIHGGGLDLKFPHHENEIAQSESYTGKTLANFWIHNGVLTVEGEKMSKSLGNFITISKAINDIGPELLKFSILKIHYRKNFDYAISIFTESLNQVLEYQQFFIEAEKFLGALPELKTPESNSSNLKEKFENAMNQDFNTAAAIAAIGSEFKELKKLLSTTNRANEDLNLRISTLKNYAKVLGVFLESPKNIINQLLKFASNNFNKPEVSFEKIEDLKNKRSLARKEKNYQIADEVRDEALSYGIELQDNPDGTCTWRFKL